MLTKEDLLSIQKLLDERLDLRLATQYSLIQKDIRNLERKMIRKMNIIINGFDNEYSELRTRAERIENHLGFNSH